MSRQHEEPQTRHRKNFLLGTVLVTIGVLFLAEKMRVSDLADYWYIMPALIGCFGLIEILSSRQPQNIANGCCTVILAFWIYASVVNLWGWTFSTSWPIVLIAVGIKSIVAGLLSTRH